MRTMRAAGGKVPGARTSRGGWPRVFGPALLGLICAGAMIGGTGFAVSPIRVDGRIVDAQGRPVAGATVNLVPATGPDASAHSAANGQYSVVGGYRLGGYELDISAPGFLQQRRRAPGVAVLQRAPIVQGRVLDETGAGVPGAWVGVASAPDRGTAQTVADSDGFFWLRGLRPGAADVTVFADDHDSWQVRVALGADHIEQLAPVAARQFGVLDLTSDPAGLAPTLDGQPLPGCPATPCSSRIPVGDHALAIDSPLYVPWSAPVSVVRSQHLTLSAQLERKKGVLAVTVPAAADAVLLIDGIQVSATGWTGELPTGPHSIEFRSSDHWPWSGGVDVEWQQRSQIAVADRAIVPGDEAAFVAGLNAYLASLGGQYGVWLEDLNSGRQVAYHGTDSMEAASVIKLPLALYLLDQARQDKLKLTDTIQLQDGDFMGGTGTLYYSASAGDSYSYQDLLALLIQQSDNTAWKALDRVLGADGVDAYAASIGAPDCHQADDSCTPQQAGVMLARLASGTVLDAGRRQQLLQLLENTVFNDRINYYLGGLTIAHKVGMDGGVMNDAGIVYAGHPFVISMFTDGDNPDQGVQAIRDVARAAARYYSR